mmetsp:Transcript_27025/g.48850  ORF Transcript_27025/g.48850 Transcript_27025/m.48850 type:complete len:125 (-) Transcript_27025:666-1040(-)
MNVKSFGSSKIESSLIHVEYVSSESGSSDDAYISAAERGQKVRDAKKRTVTDVSLDSSAAKVAKFYHGFVFTRTPYLYMPSQQPALLINAFCCCIETAFNDNLSIAMGMLYLVRGAINVFLRIP